MKVKLTTLSLICIGLLGCQANKEPLDSYIAQVERQARKDVVSLQAALEFESASYIGHQLREPFVLPKSALVQSQPLVVKDCWQPRQRRKTGQLERFALSKLQLKGVMGSGSSVSALVQTPTGNVVRVSHGQYLGLNNGKVTRITPKSITVKETLPDGLGCWENRHVKLALK